MTTLLGLLTSEISDVIVPVNKLTSVGNQISTIDTTSDNLFLLSEIEIFGTLKYSFTGEGTRYSYYAAGGGSIKNKSSAATQWWTRSPRSTSSSYYLYVNISGAMAYTYPDRLYGVAFAFCT
jgi:hypothetical protein